jgi:predicted molibdopterin-dependent oxidoreductase YjgC
VWLQHKPGTDVALLNGIAKVIIDDHLYDNEFIKNRCEGFEDYIESLKSYKLNKVEEITGVPIDLVHKAARIYAKNSPASVLYAMGITQHSHGTDNVKAVANLAILTGNVGIEGGGVNPLRGQNNVQGACDMGALPDVLPGYQSVENENTRNKFENAWECSIPAEPGLTLTEIFEAVYEGKIKALYIVGENPILSDPNAKHIEEALKKLEFLIVQDLFVTETAKFADVILPSASFAEKDGTFTNTERRVQLVRKVVEPLGQSRPDWQIVTEVAKSLGAENGFNFGSSSEIMAEISYITPSYAGISHKRLEPTGGLQWPCPDLEHPGTPVLHCEQFACENNKGKFSPVEYKPSLELADDEYPFILTTGRSLYHFHTGTLSRKVGGLNQLKPNEQVEVNPQDAEKLGLNNDDPVKISSRRGSVVALVKVTDASSPGVVFMTFHFAETPTNQLTNPALDPDSKIPELKVCAVKIEKASEEEASAAVAVADDSGGGGMDDLDDLFD